MYCAQLYNCTTVLLRTYLFYTSNLRIFNSIEENKVSESLAERNFFSNQSFYFTSAIIWKSNQVARKRRGNGAIYRIKKRKEKVVERRIFPSSKSAWQWVGPSDFCVVRLPRHANIERLIRERAFLSVFFSGDGSTLSSRTWSRSRSDMAGNEGTF